MNFIQKILNIFSKNKAEQPKESKYFPDKQIPVDELFMENFKANGGKFLYCETIDELKDTFESILQENDWFEREALTFEKLLCPMLRENNLEYLEPKNPVFILSTCEGLVAEDGSVLFSSKQLLQFKSNQLPKNMIVIGRTSQILRTKSEGLSNIKYKYEGEIPTNITTLKNFNESVQQTDDFLQYGLCAKNLYLLLLEDL
ncbi:lactate utilization protein B/C [Capnocytophaga sp. ARDL2]|uniref:lactate utilization protein B/C n=1 Tax=Capnocytophaga sp. ARDL2 TaxID=3238809 RepID=UPI003558DA82